MDVGDAGVLGIEDCENLSGHDHQRRFESTFLNADVAEALERNDGQRTVVGYQQVGHGGVRLSRRFGTDLDDGGQRFPSGQDLRRTDHGRLGHVKVLLELQHSVRLKDVGRTGQRRRIDHDVLGVERSRTDVLDQTQTGDGHHTESARCWYAQRAGVFGGDRVEHDHGTVGADDDHAQTGTHGQFNSSSFGGQKTVGDVGGLAAAERDRHAQHLTGRDDERRLDGGDTTFLQQHQFFATLRLRCDDDGVSAVGRHGHRLAAAGSLRQQFGVGHVKETRQRHQRTAIHKEKKSITIMNRKELQLSICILCVLKLSLHESVFLCFLCMLSLCYLRFTLHELRFYVKKAWLIV